MLLPFLAAGSIVFVMSGLLGCGQQGQTGRQNQIEAQGQNGRITLVWCVPEEGAKESWESKLNLILADKGAGYDIQIREYGSGFAEEDEDPADILKDLRADNVQADIIGIPAARASEEEGRRPHVSVPFHEMVEEDLLEPLDTYADAAGEKLSTQLLPDWREQGGIHGNLFKISQYVHAYHATAYRNDLLAKYGIDERQVREDPFENEEIFTRIRDEEKILPYCCSSWELLNLRWWSVDEYAGLVCLPDGTFQCALETDEFSETMHKVADFRQKGILEVDADIGDEAFAESTVSDSNIPHTEVWSWSAPGLEQQEFEMLIVPDTKHPALGLRGGEAGNGIASWSAHKEDAFDFIKRLYTDVDLAALIMDTPEITEPKRYTNSMLVRDKYGADREKMEENCYELYKNMPSDFIFDSSDVQEEVQNMEDLLGFGRHIEGTDRVRELLHGDAVDVEAALAEVRSLLRKAGGDKIAEEANRQDRDGNRFVDRAHGNAVRMQQR